MRTVFFGTPAFSAEVLKDLLHRHCNIVAVVTRQDKPKGRSGHPLPSPVKEVALSQNLPIYQPIKASSEEFVQQMISHQPDLFVVVAYGQILPQKVLDIPKLGAINLHTSLLPKYRGAAPIQRCLIAGEKQTGVTLIKMSLAMDAGEILHQVSCSIPDEMNYGQLQEKLCQLGKEALWHTLTHLNTLKAIPQDESLVTFAPKLELEEGEVRWDRPAAELHNLIRGVTPQPGAWTPIWLRGSKKRLKILSACVAEGKSGPVGHLLADDKKKLVVGCGEGALQLLHIQLEGKKPVAAEEFLRGYPKESFGFLN